MTTRKRAVIGNGNKLSQSSSTVNIIKCLSILLLSLMVFNLIFMVSITWVTRINRNNNTLVLSDNPAVKSLDHFATYSRSKASNSIPEQVSAFYVDHDTNQQQSQMDSTSHTKLLYTHHDVNVIPPFDGKEPRSHSKIGLPSIQGKDVGTPTSTVAHVVSLIKCSNSITGFLDAAAVFRHSIHQQSFATGKSKYTYQMYAIVHEQCQKHGEILELLGYTVLIKPPPVQVSEIHGKWYREHVETENCCGSAEFIKLYAYELVQHDIVVHWDMDVALLAPMDDLFDAMLFSKDSPQGIAARQRLELQHPKEPLPDQIDAFFTRDITSAQPWEKHQGVQGGFLVARPSLDVLKSFVEFIRLGNYTGGRGEGSGWNAMGYGGFQGAMAYQGAVAFYYDQFRPHTAVELDVCRWNQVVADILWRGPERMEHHMQCREYPRDGNFSANTNCEDCRVTPIDLVKSVHYTACKKPWECKLPHPRVPRNKGQVYRLSHLTNITTCGLLFRKWYALRQDLEHQLRKFTVEPVNPSGSFHPEYFMGYCKSESGYIPMNPPPDKFDMKQIYGV